MKKELQNNLLKLKEKWFKIVEIAEMLNFNRTRLALIMWSVLGQYYLSLPKVRELNDKTKKLLNTADFGLIKPEIIQIEIEKEKFIQNVEPLLYSLSISKIANLLDTYKQTLSNLINKKHFFISFKAIKKLNENLEKLIKSNNI